MTPWVCPKCGRVYGPLVMECATCNAPKMVSKGTTPSFAGYCLTHGGFNGVRCPTCSSAGSIT